MKRVFVLLIVILCLTCKKEAFQNEKVKLYVLNFDSIKKIEDYTLIKLNSKPNLVFKYIHENRKEKGFIIKYNEYEKTLHWSSNFEQIEKDKYSNQKISNSKFSIYSEIDNLSHKNKILFNKEYGVLGISNMWNPGLIFMKNDSNTIHTREIFNILLK